MSNKKRNILPDSIYHVYNRAVEGRTIFYTEQDYNYFIRKVLFYKIETGVKMLSYSVIPNHYHFTLKEPKEPTLRVGHPKGGYKPNVNYFRGSAIAKFIGLISNSYTKYFNSTKNHSGRIFQGIFKSKLVEDEDYLQTLISYINLNPLKHGIVDNIDDWPYSSHQDYLYRAKFKLVDDEYLIDFRDYDYDKNLDFYIKRLKDINEEF